MKLGKWIALLALVLISTFSIMTTIHAEEDAKIKRAEDMALADKDVEKADKVVAYVNNIPITSGEYLSCYASAQYSNTLLQQDANKLGPQGKKIAENASKLFAKYPPETRALAQVLADTAIYSEAIKKGLLKSDQEVTEYIQSVRKMEDSSPELKKIVQVLGEERYWNDLLPRLVKKNLTIGALKTQIISEQKDWAQYKYELVKNAELKIVDTNLITSSKEEVLKYLQEKEEIFNSLF
ncbi:hypothetical protein MHOCP_06690 [Moorella humiferrea]|uniref:hypothetical protein n=1 Tax=Neomoorella humiferrea TaxID=676965 RepID=UPI0030CD65CE